jgi:hypothetical protein
MGSTTSPFWQLGYVRIVLFLLFSSELNRLVDFHEIWYRGNTIQGDLDAIILNPKTSTILKWLRLKFVSFWHDFQPSTAMVWDRLIVGLLWLDNIQSLANVTMATIAIGKVGKLVLPITSCL